MPALLTRISSLPYVSIVCLISASTAAASVTSAPCATAVPPDAVMAAAVASALVPRATHTTAAPPPARRSAIARPIPRDAPVTIATLPSYCPIADFAAPLCRREQGLDRGKVAGTFDVENGGAVGNALDHSAQRFARPHFNISGDAFRRKALHQVLPSYWGCDLADQGVDRLARRAFGLSIDVRDHRNTRSVRPHRTQLRRQPLFGRLHQRAMEWRAHLQRHGPARTQRLGALAGPCDRGSRAGNHDLAAAIQVRRADHLALRRFRARLVHALFIERENRRHGAVTNRHRFLHVAAAVADQPHRVLECERARRDVSRIFTETMAGDE